MLTIKDIFTNEHELKTDHGVFNLSWDGKKPFEIRYNDRGFLIGDELVLKETQYSGDEMKGGKPLVYTGRRIRVKILSRITGYGLGDGWCVMGVKELHRVEES